MPDAEIAAVMHRQDGVIDLRQLRSLGVSRTMIEHRLKAGRWARVHRAVFAVAGVPLSWRGRGWAAALAAGPDGRLSHVACAATVALLPEPAGRIDVTRPRGNRRSPTGLRFHVAQLPPADCDRNRELPVTSVPRLMLDLAETQPRRVLERAYNEALVRKLLTRRALADALPRWTGRRGLAVLADLVGEETTGTTRSWLEDEFLPLVRTSRLPLPETNQWVEGLLVDAVWPRERVIVELDGRTFHDTDPRFESDRARTNRLLLAGWIVLRFTYRRLTQEPQAVVAELAAALAHGERAAA